MVAFFFKIWQI